MPLWAQVEADLDRRLESGEFDDRFPTDLELTETYGVSRHTVREAVSQLNRSGVLTRERGRGTVVNRVEFEQSLGALYSLYQSVESTGVEQASELLESGIVHDSVAAEKLELDDAVGLVLLSRLRLAGGSPLAIDRVWIPAELGEALLSVDWTRTALYDELGRIGAPVPNQGWERVSPTVPVGDDADRLGLATGEACFFLERLGRRDGRPVEWRTTIIRGDRFRFVSEWSAGARSGLRPAAI
jgi:GntR family transcriptional regulator